MSMDSAMDSLSNASDHSIASSNDSMNNNNNNNNIKSNSPRQNINNNRDSMNSHHSIHSTDKNQSMSPSSSPTPRRNSISNSDGIRSHRDSRSSPLSGSAPQMIPMPHPLSPPHVSTPSNMVGMQSRMAQGLSHLPPHGLGLLNSFMHHANPLDLMAAAHHHVPPRSYNSPPPISSADPTANECKLVDYRGQKVAAFIINGDTMLCLPQAFELFLKHLVGGLHTVYTKLKRLDIVPLVCNVEQVRILRGLGAIQPGVNRCKLLACKDFDILYRDCTTARCLSIKPPESSRPGRPPKRGPVGLSLPATHMSSHHSQLKKHRLDSDDYSYENGHLSDMSRLDKSPLLANGYNAPPTHINPMPFMQMNHHGTPHGMINPGLPPHNLPRPDGSLVKNPNIPGMEAITRSGIWENCRAAYEDIVKHLERLRDERGEERRDESKLRESHNSPSNGHSPVLNLSKADHSSVGDHSERSEIPSREPSLRDEDEMSEGNDNISEVDDNKDKVDGYISDNEEHITNTPPPSMNPINELDARQQNLNYSALAAAQVASDTQDPGLSSTETLLRNIQGLLKVAADNARQQERQISFEKAELKMDLLREREVKVSIDRQLSEEQKLRGIYQRKYKKERRCRLKLQEQIESDLKKRNQLEEILKSTGAPSEALKILSEMSTLNPALMNNNKLEKEKSHPRDHDKDSERNERDKEREKLSSSSMSEHKFNITSPNSRPISRDVQSTPSVNEGKTWNYPAGLDIMASGAFWQNYSESLAQEMELERKRQPPSDNDSKQSVQDRPNFYKNSAVPPKIY